MLDLPSSHNKFEHWVNPLVTVEEADQAQVRISIRCRFPARCFLPLPLLPASGPHKRFTAHPPRPPAAQHPNRPKHLLLLPNRTPRHRANPRQTPNPRHTGNPKPHPPSPCEQQQQHLRTRGLAGSPAPRQLAGRRLGDTCCRAPRPPHHQFAVCWPLCVWLRAGRCFCVSQSSACRTCLPRACVPWAQVCLLALAVALLSGRGCWAVCVQDLPLVPRGCHACRNPRQVVSAYLAICLILSTSHCYWAATLDLQLGLSCSQVYFRSWVARSPTESNQGENTCGTSQDPPSV